MRWELRNSAASDAVMRLAAEASLSPVIARLLVARGIAAPEEALRFLAPSLDQLHSPYLMLGMKEAVERVRAAIERKEKIFIYGDYDVDGTTAVVILKTAIELCGGSAEFHVPHRLREGYGMRDEVLERAAADGMRLVISVDTGIRAFHAAATTKRLGLDLIVTDHHLPNSNELPNAWAVLNPNRPGCNYPSKFLCGAGVAFKLAQALLEQSGRARMLPSFLKVVAIATIADAVPLLGENRVFAKLGLEGLRSPVNPGLKALLEVSAITADRPLEASDVAFRLAPRLNAAGRMDVARDVIELFTVRDTVLAKEMAERLTHLNTERQQEEAQILDEAEARIAADAALREAWCLVIDGEGWHRGVIGIVASRLVERYWRPVLVISREGSDAQGSGRSIEPFHLVDALESCAHLFTRYGGHAHAAGFALPCENIAELRVRMDAAAHVQLTPADLERKLEIDDELSLDNVTPAFFDCLRQLEPFGMGNPRPVFAARNVRAMFAPRILREKHAKLRVRQAGPEARTFAGKPFDALGWHMADRVQGVRAGDSLDIAFALEHNPHPDFGGLQLSLRDLRPAALSVAGENS